jgi:hypothetical protein
LINARLDFSGRIVFAAVLSDDAVTMRDPSGLKAAEITWPSWPRRTAIFRGGRGVPDAGGLVPRRRDDARPLGAEGGGNHCAVMAAQDRGLLGGRGVRALALGKSSRPLILGMLMSERIKMSDTLPHQ